VKAQPSRRFSQDFEMAEQAVVSAQSQPTKASSQAWERALALVGKLTVDMPIPSFTVSDALRLEKHSVIDSHWRVDADIALRVNGRLIAGGEFEVVGNHLAVRLTELI
jgi:flagellar motor switch/type III secretory pathway protein FliN